MCTLRPLINFCEEKKCSAMFFTYVLHRDKKWKKLNFSRISIFANFVINDIVEIFAYIFFRNFSENLQNSHNLMFPKINDLKTH